MIPKNQIFILILLILFIFSGSIFGGEISSELDSYINLKSRSDELIPIVIHMKEKLDVKSMSTDLRNQSASKQFIHKQIITSLQSIAKNSQHEIISIIEKEIQIGNAKDLTTFWVFNGMTLEATPSLIKQLASLESVELVREQLEIHLINDKFYSIPPAKTRAEVKDFGVKQIKADQMWALGYRGDGIIVANFDTGVNLNHKDLSGKWLGNTKPASECWFDPWSNTSQPVDGGTNTWQHGTHTMATIIGDDVSGGVHYGVAPNAKWIAARMFSYDGNASETNTIKCFQWLADPDGNPATNTDVPHICNNSWGATNPYTGAGVCNSGYYTYIDNCENLGIVLLFSAGNNGEYGSKTIGSPASRITTYLNAFSIGATDSSRNIGSFSSRGPSTCDGSTIKPEVSAPGVQVWSADGSSTNGYKYGDGTSMACPHAAGAAALLLQYKPDATVIEIKKALYYTATYGYNQHGEDNNFGRGIIDVMAAKDYLQPVADPNIDYVSKYIDDSSGNSNNYADPGESIKIQVTLKNTGSNAASISGVLSSTDPYVTISDSSSTFQDISTNSTGTTNFPHFSVSIDGGCPLGHVIQFTLNITSNGGSYNTSKSFFIQVGTPTANTHNSTDTPIAIPDNNTTGITSNLDLSNVGTIADINIYLNITHTYIGDLKITLISPEGTPIVLHNKSGGGTDNIVGWYDTDKPEDGPGKLDDLVGENGSGNWRIAITDTAGQDTGQLNSWKLEITSYGQPTDSIPPSDISNLSAVSGTVEGTVKLTWTSPGDDGNSGQAAKYILKYNTVLITSGNWNSSSEVTGLPTPKTAGGSESITLSGLTPGQLYYFALKTEDEIPNTSGLSNVPSAAAKQAAPILLVDDDNGGTVETYYTSSLDAGAYVYDTWSVKDSGSPDSSKLQSYQYVIWFTGGDYQTTLTTTDENNLKLYLNNGGRLFLVSDDYLYQITGGTDGNLTQDFPKNYLKIDSCDNDVGDSYETTANGVGGDPISNGLNLTINASSPITNYADAIFSSTADVIFYNNKPEPCGLRYDNGT
ncbi:S8 family serine peptidase, partial [Candidatus Dependentiae bacterium]|nr:S8 family serine peptidase [Candidatus Dependentiae bacterium]